MQLRHLLLPLLMAFGSAAPAVPAPYVPEPHQFTRVEAVPQSGIAVPLDGETVKPGDFITTRSLNGEWSFSGVVNSAKPFPADTDLDSGFMKPEFDASKWGKIAVPLNWFQKFPQARKQSEPYTKGLYRTSFELSAAEMKDRRVILKFDCVGYEGKVFLNGKEVGNHHGDFTSFEIDATDAAKAGRNVLALRVFSSFGPTHGLKEKIVHPYGSQWGIGNIKGGIWQNVTLSLEPELRIQKIFVNPSLADNSLGIDYTIVNHTGKPFNGTLDCVATDAMKAHANAEAGTLSIPVTLKPGVNTGSVTLKLKNPELWSVDRPYLYFLNLLLRESGGTVSAASTRFGFREFHTKDGRFYLNGKEIYLFGENISSVSYGGYGHSAAAEDARLTDFILTMKNYGYNIMRTPHMPILPAALEIADECGMMIFNEWAWCFDNTIDEAGFEKHNIAELKEFVNATYNHPSVVMWSLGNEVNHSNRPDVVREMDRQVKTVHELDKQKRPVSSFSGAAGWSSYGREKLVTDVLDLHTYVALSAPWVDRNAGADKIYEGLLNIYGEKNRLSRPLIAWENVGFSWGFLYSDNKNPDFKRNDPEQYMKYVEGETSWGNPRGIGYSGCMSLAEAVDPKVGADVPMTRFGKRIFELYRLDRRFSGFAPWFGDAKLKTATLWTQPVLPVLQNAHGLPPRDLYAGESSRWTLVTVNDSNTAYKDLKLELALTGEDGKILPVSTIRISELPAQRITAQPVELPLPQAAPGFHQLRMTLFENGKELARNYYELSIQSPSIRSEAVETVRPVYVYDTGAPKNVERLKRQLGDWQIKNSVINRFDGLKTPGVVIVPAESEETQLLKLRDDAELRTFLSGGGILLVLAQKNPQSEIPGPQLVEGAVAFCDPIVTTHPVFNGLDARNFDCWDNETGYVVTASYMPFTVNALAAKGAMLGRKDVGMALVEATFGKGRIILSQLLATTSTPQDSSAMLYLRNLIGYAAGAKELWKDARPFSKLEDGGFQVNPDRVETIDLAPFANRGFSDEKDGDQAGGWTDQGENDFRMMPVGRVTEAGGIPFDIVDPAKNGGKSCIVLAGTERPYFPLAVKEIKVDRKFSRLFFLHTAAWGGAENAGSYRIHYSDGKTVTVPLTGNRNIGDWWNANPLPEARAGIFRKNPSGQNVGTFVMAWENPRPDETIASLDFLSPLYRDKTEIDWAPKQTAVPVLIAVSGEKPHPNPVEITGKAYRNLLPCKDTGTTLAGIVREGKTNGRREWNITFPAARESDCPAAFFQFNQAGMSDHYDVLALTIRSKTPGTIEVVLPQKDWKGNYRGFLRLDGDGKPHVYRMRLGKELNRNGNFPVNNLRGELFFFDRSSDSGTTRPRIDFTIERAVLE